MSFEAQVITISIMFGSGMLLGILLDSYHVVKARLQLTGWVVSLVDLLYWIGSAGLIFALLLWSNWGELRLYVFIAITLGFFVYFRICHRWLIGPLCFLFRLIEIIISGLIQLCYYLLWAPFTYLVQMTGRILQAVIIVPFCWIFRPGTWLKRFKSKQNKEK